jgi:putative protease
MWGDTEMMNKNLPHRVELLAPVGKWDVLEAVIAAGANAVYLGGKKYNMRLHREDFNFSEEDLREAVKYAHRHRVKLYVTVNNLLTNAEMAQLPAYLNFLQEIEPDALIVQDLGVIALAHDMGLTVPLHASVMMNAHNQESLELLMDQRVKRAILSRDMSLTDIKLIHERLPIELEYFAHGDMCFAQGSQCYHCGMIFGESSNRGRCLKTCRWPYELVNRLTGETLPVIADGPYFMAVKDMCMLPFLPEVIDAGICSLKIEGRMRGADYLAPLIGFYRRALDKFYTDPSFYAFDWEEFREIEDIRARDLSSLYAFGHPGPAAVDYTGEREPRFFSQAVKEPLIKDTDLAINPLPQPEVSAQPPVRPLLAVKVGSKEAALTAIMAGAEILYTSGESFRSQGQPWQTVDYRAVIAAGQDSGCRIVLGLPRITMPEESSRLKLLVEKFADLQPDGLQVTNLGSVYEASRLTDLPLYADYSCNIANYDAARFLSGYRVGWFTAALELSAEELLSMSQGFALPLEAVIHGTLPTMVSEHCLPAALLDGKTKYQICSGCCEEVSYGLRDSAGGVHPIEIDQYCRNHIFLVHELGLLPYLRTFYGAGLASLRLEIPTYQADEAGEVTAIYRRRLKRVWQNPDDLCSVSEWEQLQHSRPVPFGTGPYTRGIRVKVDCLASPA